MSSIKSKVIQMFNPNNTIQSSNEFSINPRNSNLTIETYKSRIYFNKFRKCQKIKF